MFSVVERDHESGSAGAVATACMRRRPDATREAPTVEARDLQPAAREGQVGPCEGGGEDRSTGEAG